MDDLPLKEGRGPPVHQTKKRIGKAPDALTGQRPVEILQKRFGGVGVLLPPPGAEWARGFTLPSRILSLIKPGLDESIPHNLLIYQKTD